MSNRNALSGVIVNKLSLYIIASEFDSSWVFHNSGLVLSLVNNYSVNMRVTRLNVISLKQVTFFLSL